MQRSGASGPVELGDLTWPEAGARTGTRTRPPTRPPVRTVLLVPLGATEQHGPHLPLDTDTRVAVAVSRIVAARRDDVLVAPGLPYGASGEHRDFPGTLTIGTEALVVVLVELGRSVWPGVDRIVFVSGHGGNADAVGRAVRRLRDEGRDVAAWFPSVPGGDAHAGRTETSLLLAIAPGAVRTGRAAPGTVAPLEELLPALRADGVRAVSANGVLGDPGGASAAEGRDVLAALARDLEQLVASRGVATTGTQQPGAPA